MLTATSNNPVQLPLFATEELAATIKKMTSLDKDVTFYPSTQMEKSSPILAVASTSKEKVFCPYWTDLCLEISSNLLLPTKTDLQDLDSTLFDTWLSTTVGQSWFSTNLIIAHRKNSFTIFSPSLQSLVQESMGLDDTVRKSKKIRIYPTKQQQKKLDKWFGVSRFVFNQTVEYLRQPGTKANWKGIKGEILNSLPDFCADVPYQIKSIAIKDACTAVKSAKKKYANGDGIQKVSFRSRKNPVQSCYIPKSAVKTQGIYYTMLGSLRYGEDLPHEFGDCRLSCRYGKYYLCVPHESPRHVTENQGRVVALDPGVRTFLTFFSEDSFGWLGDGANMIIQKMCYRLDDLISRMSKASAKKKKSMKIAADRLRGKIIAKVDELHKKCARFLCDNFDVILLPTFETKQMSSKAKRRIRSKSVRQMLSLSHYRFKQFLKHKAFETGKMVLDVCEAYTSKTVSWTGEIVNNLGGSKTIKSQDGRSMDRDLNGARGIFLRSVVDTPLLNENLNNYFAANPSVC